MRFLSPLILYAVVSFAALPVRAQRVLSETTLRYQITVLSPDDGRAVPGIGDIQYAVFLKGGQGRTEMTSSLGTESTIYDPRSGSGYIIKEYGGNRLLVNAGPADWIAHNKTYHNLSFAPESGNFPVGNYKCVKANALLPSGKKIVVLYDPSVVLPNYEYHLAFAGLKGLPVSFELEQGGLIYKYELISLNTDPVSYGRFQVPGKGYRILSYEELKKMNEGNK